MTDQNQMEIPQTKKERIEKLKKLLFVKKNLEESITRNIDKRDDISGTKKDLMEGEQNLLADNMVESAKKFKKCKTDKDFTKEATKVLKEIQKIGNEEEKKRQIAVLGKINILFGEFLKSNEKNTKKNGGFEVYIQEKIKNLKSTQATLENQVTTMDSREEVTRNFINEKNKEINKYLDNFRKEGPYEDELKGIDLSGQNLMNLDFSNLNLQESKLVGSILHGTNFSRSDLSKSDLSLAYASVSRFEEANLKEVTFNTEVNLNNVNNLIPTDAKNKKETRITHANLKKANLDGVDLDKVDLDQSIMEETSLNGTKFTKNTNLYATKLCKSNLDNADFSGAKFDKTCINNNQKILLEKKGINVEECIIKEIELGKQQIHPTERTIQGIIKNKKEEQQLTFTEKREKLGMQQNSVNDRSIPFS